MAGASFKLPKGDESSVVRYREREQVHIRDLPRADQLAPVDDSGIDHTDIVCPELMMMCSRRLLQPLGHKRSGESLAVWHG